MANKLRWNQSELFYNTGDGWQHYTKHPLYRSIGDYNIPQGSRGYKMMQYLLKQCDYTYDQPHI